jgi:glyoxylase-like metal-dependent hydrolase (beta-lactamase superfamily II)
LRNGASLKKERKVPSVGKFKRRSLNKHRRDINMHKRAVLKKILLAVAILFTFCRPVFAAEKLTQIAENVYAYVDTKNSSKDNSFGANAGIIIGKNGILVVDTLISSKEAKRFFRDIKAVSCKPIKYVVNTHYHLDHSFGNYEFARRGVVIIVQENAKNDMENTAEETLKNIGVFGLTTDDMKGTKLAYPVLAYGDKMEIDLGDQKIVLIHSRHSHTEGDTLVYLPDKKVLFTGDVLFTNYHPFLGEGNIEEWVKELDDIKSMDVEKIIPGHGPLSTKKDVDDMKAYILMFDQKARELASSSGNVQEIVAAIQKYLPQRPEGAWIITANIQIKYLKKTAPK